MNISQAKLINLVDFLKQEGHKAVKQAHLLSRLTPAEMNGMTMV